MADKLPYDLAITQVCFMVGLGEQRGGTPVVTHDRGIVETKTGERGSVRLIARKSDIQSAWDPIQADAQIRARDKLADSIRKFNPRSDMSLQITPNMWQVS